MQLSSKSPATRVALLYITIGAVGIVWTLIWIVYLYNHPPHSASTYYICAGLLATGFIVLLIGLGIGSIGRSARDAETPNVVAPPVQPIQPTPIAPAVATQIPVPTANGGAAAPGIPTITPQVPIASPSGEDVPNRVPAVVPGPQVTAQR